MDGGAAILKGMNGRVRPAAALTSCYEQLDIHMPVSPQAPTRRCTDSRPLIKSALGQSSQAHLYEED